MKLSLMFFASGSENAKEAYDLLFKAVTIADKTGFEAVWLPERHFNPFGGIYPSPAVLAASLAPQTQSIRIRSGSIVMGLNNPLRVAEEWIVIDNLSNGRVDLGFAQGWNPMDFAIAPQNYHARLDFLYRGIETIQRLWKGESVECQSGTGEAVNVNVYPRPVQRDLDIWLTCVGGADRFRDAGAKGFNILTALLFQSYSDLQDNIADYRNARKVAGFDPDTGKVTLMLHSFMAASEAEVLSQVRQPLLQYLRGSFDLWKGRFTEMNELDASQKELIWEFAFQKYYKTCGLFGVKDRALETIRMAKEVGVDEIACLIDFGVESASVLESVKLLGELISEPDLSRR